MKTAAKKIVASLAIGLGVIIGGVVTAAPAQAASTTRVCNLGSEYLEVIRTSGTYQNLYKGQCVTGVSYFFIPGGFAARVNGGPLAYGYKKVATPGTFTHNIVLYRVSR